jgi:hypothetical protein
LPQNDKKGPASLPGLSFYVFENDSQTRAPKGRDLSGILTNFFGNIFQIIFITFKHLVGILKRYPGAACLRRSTKGAVIKDIGCS